MNTYADQTQANKTYSTPDKDPQRQGGISKTASQPADNRPDAIAQRKLQETISNSPQAKNLRAHQEGANQSPQVKQLRAYQAMANGKTDHENTARENGTAGVIQKKTLDQAGQSAGLKSYKETRTTVGDDKLKSRVYEQHVENDAIGKVGALQIAAEKNGDIGARIHNWGKAAGVGKRDGKPWQAQQMFTRENSELEKAEIKTLDPFFFAVTVPFQEKGRPEALALVFQHSADLQGYVETIVDTSNSGAHDYPSMYKGKPGKVKDDEKNPRYPQLHDPETEDQLLIDHTAGGEESNLDAYTKIAGEGARWVCVREHASNLRNTSFFYTSLNAPAGNVRALMFSELWVSWKDTFNKEYNIPDEVVKAKIGDLRSKLNNKVEIMPYYEMGSEDYDLDGDAEDYDQEVVQHVAQDITVQRKENTEETNQGNAQPIQRAENKTGLPDQLKSGIENLSGYSMDSVKVHYNSDKPAQLQAHAYAQGADIHLAPGQEKHLPHEAWHVVQQKQGRVKPTMQLKGQVNVNDDTALEKEADVMGAKALQMKDNTDLRSVAEHTGSGSAQPAQRVKFDYEGYDFDSEDLTRLAYWTTTMASVNPERLEKLRPFVKNHLLIPSPDKVAMIHIIDSSTRHLSPGSQKASPIRSTVYGLDKAKGKEGSENIALAYEQGFRDFDAAVLYHEGNTAELFRSLKVDKGIVRIIYKYQLEEFDAARKDMLNLISIPGIHIHTVMLHDIPISKPKKVEAFKQLKFLSAEFGAKIGLSNVQQLDNITSEDNLTNLLDLAKENDIKVSSIQNRISPSAPDTRVRQIAKENGIDYMGFGLQGGDKESEKGTCSMDETTKVESYDITTDPLFKTKIAQLGLSPEKAKRAMLEWARLKDVKVISSSTTAEGMSVMMHPFATDLIQHLDMYGHGNQHYANSSDPAAANSASLYLPFETYLTQNGIKGAFDIIHPLAPDPMWRLLYKHAIAAKDNKSILQALTAAGTVGANEINILGTFLFPGGVKSVTALGNIFTRYISGMRGVVYPVNATSVLLSQIGTGSTMFGEALLVSDNSSFEQEEGAALVLLNDLKDGDNVFLYMNDAIKATYLKVTGNWVKQ